MLSYPSETFPSLSGVAVEPPEGWLPLHVPGSVVGCIAPLEEGRFRANAFVTLTRLSSAVQLEEMAAEIDAQLDVLPQREDISGASVTLSGIAGRVREVAFVDDTAGTLAQVHWYGLVPRGDVTDFVHLTGTCGADRPQELLALRDLVRSLKVGTG